MYQQNLVSLSNTITLNVCKITDYVVLCVMCVAHSLYAHTRCVYNHALDTLLKESTQRGVHRNTLEKRKLLDRAVQINSPFTVKRSLLGQGPQPVTKCQGGWV